MAPPGETKQLAFLLLKAQNGFLKCCCFLIPVQKLWKIDCSNFILLFNDILMSPPFCCKMAFKTTSPVTDACETFRHASLHIRSPTCTTSAAVQADRGRPLFSSLSIHCCCQFYSATSHAEIPQQLSKVKSRLLTFARLHQLCYKFDELRVNGRVQSKTALKCAKNYRNWLRRSEHASRWTEWPPFLGHPELQQL